MGVGMAGIRTRGGKKLLRKIRDLKRETRKVDGVSAEAGFPRGIPASLAVQHEFGNPATKLPERPAFRAALAMVRAEFRKATLRERPIGLPPDARAIKAGAVAAATELRRGYLEFEGAPLSAAVRERKAGTPGEGRQLVGEKRPKLITKITAWVNRRRVDMGGSAAGDDASWSTLRYCMSVNNAAS